MFAYYYITAGSAVTLNGGNLSLQREPVKAEVRTDRLTERREVTNQSLFYKWRKILEEQRRDICREIWASKVTEQEPL